MSLMMRMPNDLKALKSSYAQRWIESAPKLAKGFAERTGTDLARAESIVRATLTQQMDWMAVFIMAMRARQPATVGKIRAQGPGALRDGIRTDQYQGLARPTDPPSLEEWTERHFPGLIDDFGMSLLPDIASHPETALKLLRMRWGVLDVSIGKTDLLLSDQPGLWTGGIDASQLIIALPLSPVKAFIAVRGDQVAENLLRTPPADLATRLNESSVGQAIRRVYGRDETAADFVRNIVAKSGRHRQSAD